MTQCPYDGMCPHLVRLREDFERAEDVKNKEMELIVKSLSEVRKTLFIIIGILVAELGVTIL